MENIGFFYVRKALFVLEKYFDYTCIFELYYY